MHDHGYCRCRVAAHGHAHFWHWRFSYPFLLGLALDVAGPRAVLHNLALDLVQRLADGQVHLRRLGQSNHRINTPSHGDLRLTAVLLHRKNYFRFEIISKNAGEFFEADFDLFADVRCDFTLPAGVFHVHRTSPFKTDPRTVYRPKSPVGLPPTTHCSGWYCLSGPLAYCWPARTNSVRRSQH